MHGTPYVKCHYVHVPDPSNLRKFSKKLCEFRERHTIFFP